MGDLIVSCDWCKATSSAFQCDCCKRVQEELMRIERIIGEQEVRYKSWRVRHFVDDVFAAIRGGHDA